MSSEKLAGRDTRRFVEGGERSPLDDRISRSLRHATELPGLPDARIEAIGRALVASRPARGSVFSYAVVVVALLAFTGAAAAFVRMNERKVLHAWASQPRLAAERAALLHEVRDTPREATGTPRELEAQAAPRLSTTPMIESLPARRPASPSRVSPSPSRVSPSPPSPAAPPVNVPEAASESSALGAEARLLRRAIESLRSESNPRKTLALLDQHRSIFPDGRLRANADLLRVDALLAMGSRSEALAMLELLPLDTWPRGDDLLVTRGELRADADCPAAVRDFDKALARPLSEKLAERALRGRAVCRVRGGDRSAAESDLRLYLERFPNGKFAARARELLARR